MKHITNFFDAVKARGNSYILCNKIPELACMAQDENFLLRLGEIECNENGDVVNEIFQFFISDCCDDEVTYLENRFDSIHFAYADFLDSWVLCVTHFGTAWDCVSVTDNEFAGE